MLFWAKSHISIYIIWQFVNKELNEFNNELFSSKVSFFQQNACVFTGLINCFVILILICCHLFVLVERALFYYCC